MEERDPFGFLATAWLLNKIRIGADCTIGRGVETHNYRTTRERGVPVGSWSRTYRLFVMKHGGVDPDEVDHGGVPIL